VSSDGRARDRAGQALYEEGQSMLPGLGQPPAPAWKDLEPEVRERWRVNADRAAPLRGPDAGRPTPPLAGSSRAGAPRRHL
jgi:hypothetical protein